MAGKSSARMLKRVLFPAETEENHPLKEVRKDMAGNNNDSSRVYVTQIPARLEGGNWVPIMDISPAGEFGELKIMLPSGMNFHAAAPAVQQLREQLREFRGDKDYLLPLGDPLIMAAAAALIARREPMFRMLKWDRYTRLYHAYEVKV